MEKRYKLKRKMRVEDAMFVRGFGTVTRESQQSDGKRRGEVQLDQVSGGSQRSMVGGKKRVRTLGGGTEKKKKEKLIHASSGPGRMSNKKNP